MSGGPVRIEADGTRVYKSGHRYRPVAPEARRNQVRKPDHPDAVRFRGDWFLPLQTLPEASRCMPETRPDAQTLEHRASCTCEVCSRPEARRYWRRARRQLRP